MTEAFFEHLRQHAVPLNETAIRQIRDSATALDLYTWLAYRLPRINPKRPATISWQQLAVHFGNDGKNIRKFRQTGRRRMGTPRIGGLSRRTADFDTTIIRLHASPAPLQQKFVPGAHLRLASDDNGTATSPLPSATVRARSCESPRSSARSAPIRQASTGSSAPSRTGTGSAVA